MLNSLLAFETIAPMTGGIFLAGAAGFIGSLFLSRKNSEHSEVIPRQSLLTQLEDEIQRLNRQIASHRFADQILNDFVEHDDFQLAISAFLKRLVPRPSSAFAAIIPMEDDLNWPKRARGLSESSLGALGIPDDLVPQLKARHHLVIRPQDDQGALFHQLDESDRSKARELHLTALAEQDEMLAVLVTSFALSQPSTDCEHNSFPKRLSKMIGMRWRQTRAGIVQTRDLRTAHALLELRSIIDANPDEPLKTLEQFATRLREITSADRVSIYFVARRSGERLQPIVQSGRPLTLHDQPAWSEHEQALAVDVIDAMEGRQYDRQALEGLQIDSLIKSAVAIPIHVNGRILGAICLSQQQQNSHLLTQRKLIECSVESLSQTLRRVLDQATIRRQARHDHLTDLVNRRSFDAYLATEIERIDHLESTACSLILADLDHFKSINDRYGHQTGDHVLRSAARLLAEQVSQMRLGEHSIVARYGGEEFAILLPNVGLAGATRIAEGIRCAIESECIRIQNERIGVTISLGVAAAPLHGKTSDSLVAAADHALYQAKSSGRNCVCEAQSVLV